MIETTALRVWGVRDNGQAGEESPCASGTPFAGRADLDPEPMEGALLDTRAVALIIILVGAVLVVVTRVRRNTPGAIVAYAVLAVGLLLGVLSR